MRKTIVNCLVCLFLLALAVEVPAEDGQTRSRTSCAAQQTSQNKPTTSSNQGSPASPMPEPGAAILFSLGGVGLLLRQRHQRLKQKRNRV